LHKFSLCTPLSVSIHHQSFVLATNSNGLFKHFCDSNHEITQMQKRKRTASKSRN